MTPNELEEARKNSDFIAYINHREKEVLESKSISGLYEVLDMWLILDLDESRINKVYELILTVAFEQIEQRLQSQTKLKLTDNDSNDKFYIRAFYEHSIEKWSNDNTSGAKELFFVLSQIVEDEKLLQAINITLLACDENIDIDKFYNTKILHKENVEDEKYA